MKVKHQLELLYFQVDMYGYTLSFEIIIVANDWLHL
jgi:hypothetical protein